MLSVAVEVVVVTIVMWLATPPAGKGKTAQDLGIDLGLGIDMEATHGSALHRGRRVRTTDRPIHQRS